MQNTFVAMAKAQDAVTTVRACLNDIQTALSQEVADENSTLRDVVESQGRRIQDLLSKVDAMRYFKISNRATLCSSYGTNRIFTCLSVMSV